MAVKKKAPTKSATPKKPVRRNKLESQLPVESIVTPDIPSTESGNVDVAVSAPVEVVSAKEPFVKNVGWFVLAALVLGWSVDLLFWEQQVQLNFVIFMFAVVIGGIVVLAKEGKRPNRTSLWLLLPFIFFVVFTFIRNEPLTRFLAFVGVLFSLGVFVSTYVGGRWMEYGLPDYFSRFFILLGNSFGGGVLLMTDAQKAQTDKNQAKNKIPVGGILRGLAIALPIVICFASLLAAGDVVFNQKLQDFFDFEDFGETVWRIVMVVFWAYIIVGVFRFAAINSHDKQLSWESDSRIKPFLGFTETTVILASVSLLFMIFVSIQFEYFFGGARNIGVTGYSYSQYARRGFNELVIVAFLTLVLTLGLSSVARRDTDIQKRVYSWLSAFMVGLVLIILVAAYQRISLAIDWHGFSRLRLYPRIFLIWLALLLVAVIALEITRRERYFAFAAVIASMGFAANLILFNVDAAVIKYNTPRVLTGKWMNVGHLASLSTDAVPALVNEYRSKKYSTEDHEKIGAALACHLYFMSREAKYAEGLDWRSFNLSWYQAEIALDSVEASLQEYSVLRASGVPRARTPGKVLYDCRYSGYEE